MVGRRVVRIVIFCSGGKRREMCELEVLCCDRNEKDVNLADVLVLFCDNPSQFPSPHRTTSTLSTNYGRVLSSSLLHFGVSVPPSHHQSLLFFILSHCLIPHPQVPSANPTKHNESKTSHPHPTHLAALILFFHSHPARPHVQCAI